MQLAVHLSSPSCGEQWLFRNDVQEFDLGPLGGIDAITGYSAGLLLKENDQTVLPRQERRLSGALLL